MTIFFYLLGKNKNKKMKIENWSKLQNDALKSTESRNKSSVEIALHIIPSTKIDINMWYNEIKFKLRPQYRIA